MADSNKSLILVGAGGHAMACIDAIESQGVYSILGLIGITAEIGKFVCGYPILGSDQDLKQMVGKADYALVAVGAIDEPERRRTLIGKVVQLGFLSPIVIAKSAQVSKHARVDVGAVIMHGAVINAGAQVGQHCVINSQSLIEHEVKIGDYTHVSTGVCINGRATVGESSFVGSGSVIRNNIVVGRNCFIGMSQAVVRNVPDDVRIVDVQRS